MTTITSSTKYVITGAPPVPGAGTTGFNILLGAVSGTWTQTIPIPASALNPTGASGLWSQLSPQPPAGSWYACAVALGVAGSSPPSNVIQITVNAAPNPPVLALA